MNPLQHFVNLINTYKNLAFVGCLMRRRTFLATAMTVATTPGCLGYTLIETDDIETRERRMEKLNETLEKRNQRLRKQNETLESKRTRVEELEEELSDAQQRANATESELRQIKSDLQTTREDFVMTLTESAHTNYGLAASEYSSARDSSSIPDWVDASRLFSAAGNHFDAAMGAYYDARDVAAGFEWEMVRQRCNSSGEYCFNMREASQDYSLATYNYANGNDDRGDPLEADGTKDFDAAQEYTVYSAEEIELKIPEG